MQRIAVDLPAAAKPRYGCPFALRGERGHALTWDGWWQSANPEVAIPRWRCACGQRFTDAPHTRWFRDGALGDLFHN